MPNIQMTCKKTKLSQLLKSCCTSTEAHNTTILFILYLTDNLFFIVFEDNFIYIVCQGISILPLYLHKYSLVHGFHFVSYKNVILAFLNVTFQCVYMLKMTLYLFYIYEC